MENLADKNWRLSNDPKITPQEAARLLNYESLSEKERQTLGERSFFPDVKMGMDPEFFLASPEGLRLPAFGVLAHKKLNPYLFWDGFQAECTVVPQDCHQELANSLAYALSRVTHKIVPSPVWRVPVELLHTADEEHVRLGCDPSFNVYNMKGLHVEDGRKLGWRFAGGHIHFSLSAKRKVPQRVRSIVKALDAICAVPCVCFAAGVDWPVRRRYYGLPGEFRLPEHGVEYRTLSNFWMYHPQGYHLVFDLARFAFNIGKGGLNRCFVGDQDLVTEIIQFSDVRSARDLVKLNKPLYKEFLKSYPMPARAAFWRAVDTGFKQTIPDFGTDINGEWKKVVDAYKQPMWKDMK